MPNSTYFIQDCPTCGRSLRIRVEYLGKALSCPHCLGDFDAVDPENQRPTAPSGMSLMRRADELLSSVDYQTRPS